MEPQTPEIGSTSSDASVSQANKDESNSVNDELNNVLNVNKLDIGEVDAGRGSFGIEEDPSPIGDEHLTVSQQKVSFIKVLMIFYFLSLYPVKDVMLIFSSQTSFCI